MRTFTAFPLTLLFLLVFTLPLSAVASNKSETEEEEVSAEEAPETASPAPEQINPKPDAEPAMETPLETGASSTGTEIDTADSEDPENEGREETPRPELPSMDEDKALTTVREVVPESDQDLPAAPEPLSPATLKMLRALETRHASIVSVRGDFDQLKVSEIFLEEIASKGTFHFKKPDQFRCDYQPPDEMTNLIREDAIYIYVPELEQCEVYRFESDQERDQQLHSMVLGFGFRTAELVEAYEIRSSEDAGPLRQELEQGKMSTAEFTLFEMTPRPELAETSPFTKLKLWIDKEQLLPKKVWFEDYNGDQTTLDIRSIELNPSIDPKLFAPTFPSGTEFIDKTAS